MFLANKKSGKKNIETEFCLKLFFIVYELQLFRFSKKIWNMFRFTFFILQTSHPNSSKRDQTNRCPGTHSAAYWERSQPPPQHPETPARLATPRRRGLPPRSASSEKTNNNFDLLCFLFCFCIVLCFLYCIVLFCFVLFCVFCFVFCNNNTRTKII